ncbi:endoplasmic reticulum retention protein [Hanseniaspora vineae]
MLNIFRILGDFSHLASIIILIDTLRKTKNVDGISMKTQLCYAIVYITRYLDLLAFHYVSLYNTIFKLVFIGSSVYTIVLIQNCKVRNPIAFNDMIQKDSFPIKYLIAVSTLLALIFNYKFTFFQLLWSFSIWLESVCILPQLFMLSKAKKAATLTTHYIFFLGLYRLLYIPNWVWRFYTEERFEKISFFAGIIQTLLYSDFFYIYYKRVLKGKNFELPH